jgi:peptide chain release factor subunit 1
MITRKDIERLVKLHTDDGIVSAYIKVDPRLAYERNQPSMKFKGAFARARRNADERTIGVLDRERDRILEYLDDWEQHGKALVIFASTPAGVWEAIELDVAIPTVVSVANDPDTSHLARALEENPRLAVVLLDGGEARLYFAEQGQEREKGRVEDELPSRHDQGGWSQGRYQRHVEFHKSQHLREVADQLKDIYHAQGFDRIVLVGVDEVTNEFAGLLQEPLNGRVIGHLAADFKQEKDDSIMDRARQLAEEDERSSEAALVEQVIGFAAAGGKGVVGLDDTILRLIEKQVDTLVVIEGLSEEGSRCLNCEYFAAKSFTKCPVCSSNECEEIPDVVEHAVEHALANGSQVNFVHDAAEEMLQARGGIGALLRYVPAELQA